MDIVSLCSLRVLGLVYRSRSGSFVQTVIAKATYVLQPGESVLAPEQEEPNEEDNHWNDDPTRSVYTLSDRIPYKPKADVMLVGHAFSPGKQPVRSLRVRLVVGGELDKSIEVWCDRGFTLQNGQLLEGPPFTKMPLRWERAAGGPETNNPVGLRFDGVPDRYGMVAIPNLQPPGIHVSQRSDTFPPECFAPVAGSWPSRTQRLARDAEAFITKAWESSLLPADFDYSYFQGAPMDQQVGELRSNERIILENLHPKHARLVTNLPGQKPRAIADRATGEREEIALIADTLWIDTDRGICTLVWRGRIGLRHSEEAGRVTFWLDGHPTRSAADTTPAHASDVVMVAEKRDEDLGDGTLTIVPRRDAEKVPALPFVEGAPAPPHMVVAIQAVAPPWLGPLANVGLDDVTGTLVAPMVASAKDPLPFAHASEVGSNALAQYDTRPVAPRPPSNDATGTIVAGLGLPVRRTDEPLPFQSSVAAEPPSRPIFSPALGSIIPEAPEIREPHGDKKMVTREPSIEAHPPDVSPPPMIGPLARAEMAGKAEAPAVEDKGDKELLMAPRPAMAMKGGLALEKQRPEAVPLEKYAALMASIACRPHEEARILEDVDLTASAWNSVKNYWRDATRTAVSDGRTDLLVAYDNAYVAQIESERGEISPAEYARLMLSIERGTRERTAAELRLPPSASLRIERVWLRRMALEPRLREGVQEELSVARARRRV